MIIHNLYIYDRLHYEYALNHNKNTFQNYHKIILCTNKTIKVYTDRDQVLLQKWNGIILPPFSFNKIELSEADSQCLIMGLTLDFPSVYTSSLQNITIGNIEFSYLNNNTWAQTNTKYNLGSYILKNTTDENRKTIYSGLKIHFSPINADAVQSVQMSFFPGFTGTMYFFPGNSTDLKHSNAICACRVESKSKYQSAIIPALPLIQDGKIATVCIVFDIEEEGQIFLGEFSFQDKNENSIAKVVASGTSSDMIFQDLCKSIKQFNISESSELKLLIMRIIDYSSFLSKKEISMLSLGFVTEFLILLLNEKNTLISPFIQSNSLMVQIINYIDKNINRKISLKEIADTFMFSESHISMLFKKNIGVPIMSYIRSKQLSIARFEIINGAKPNDIFYKYNFNNYSSFYKAFLKLYKISPSKISKTKF